VALQLVASSALQFVAGDATVSCIGVQGSLPHDFPQAKGRRGHSAPGPSARLCLAARRRERLRVSGGGVARLEVVLEVHDFAVADPNDVGEPMVEYLTAADSDVGLDLGDQDLRVVGEVNDGFVVRALGAVAPAAFFACASRRLTSSRPFIRCGKPGGANGHSKTTSSASRSAHSSQKPARRMAQAYAHIS
jgi:hypothetical protein